MGGRRDDTAANVERIVEFADIGEHIDQPVKTYSTGMVVRLGFAVATSLRPDVLITDEVLAVGDESFQKKCLRWMEQYRATGGALLLCSHSMYHIQSLCENALWIEHGRVRAKGDSYAVTQAYLEYHESKQAAMAPGHSHAVDPNVFPVIDSLWVCGADGIERSTFEMGEDLMLCGTMNCPGDQPTRIAFGIARKDLTPVFGAFSEDAAFVPNRIGLCKYAFRVRFPNIPLLPGSYVLRGHTMDEFGLRLIDTAIIEVRVTGKTRAHGLVTVPHRWENGNERNVPNGD
jgi:lipopolysaccharide transport system ATP-binding protein